MAVAVPASSLTPFDPQFATRWAGWQARGATHEAEIQHRLRVAASFLAVLAAAAVYLLNR